MRVFTACLLLMASLGARSEIIEATIDGLNYSLDTEKSEATVTEGYYEGDIVIPKSVEPKPMKFTSLILPRNENKSITRENKTAVIQHFLRFVRWEQYLKSF